MPEQKDRTAWRFGENLARFSPKRIHGNPNAALRVLFWQHPAKKSVIIGTGLIAMVGVAAAADLPRPQPVYQEAPVGKAPIGKGPIGKGPIGKGPVGPPIITKG